MHEFVNKITTGQGCREVEISGEEDLASYRKEKGCDLVLMWSLTNRGRKEPQINKPYTNLGDGGRRFFSHEADHLGNMASLKAARRAVGTSGLNADEERGKQHARRNQTGGGTGYSLPHDR